MAEIILTDAEKKAATWAELDDASLGKVVKAGMFSIKQAGEESGRLYFMAAATILCVAASEANADKLKQTIEGLTIKDKALGDWVVSVKRVKRS